MHLRMVAEHVEKLARDAGRILTERFERINQIDFKSAGNPVTEADRASEKFLRDELAQAYPDVPFYGEEYGFDGAASPDTTKACWIVDPLDGTVNYATGAPIFCVSVALLRQGEPAVGVVYDPNRDDVYVAVSGEGTTRNGKPCKVVDRDPFDHMAAVGVSADVIRVRPKFLDRFSKSRCLGSAALQMAFVAAGIYTASLDPYTRLWDVAAGALLVTEAGGTATHWDGSPLFPVSGDHPAFQGVPFDYLTSNGQGHDSLVDLTGEVDFKSADPRSL